jgi:hypothetical protein
MMRLLLKVETPLSTTVNVSNQTLILIYQKLKMNKQVKEEKHHKSEKFKERILFDFLDTKTNFNTL